MLVDCNVPYVLKVDGVEWSPIDTREGKDEYVVSSGGFFEILVDGERVFFFRNNVTPDFTHGGNNVRFYNDSDLVLQKTMGDTYAQVSFIGCNRIECSLSSFNKEQSEVAALTPSVNQGEVSIRTTASGVVVAVSNFDINTYLQIKLGNVLLAFITPAE